MPPRANQESLHAALLLVCGMTLATACHAYYVGTSGMIPSHDEALYMDGARAIYKGYRAGGLCGAWESFRVILCVHPPLVCAVAFVFMLMMGDGPTACYAALLAVFVLLGPAAYSLFRNALSPVRAATAALLFVTAPLVTGLTHRFYIESLMLLCVCVYLDLLLRGAWRSPARGALAGVVLGLGALTKLSILPLLALPSLIVLIGEVRAIVCAANRRGMLRLALDVFLTLATAIAVAWPWYWNNLQFALEHARVAFGLQSCNYPLVGSLLANISAGPSFFVSALALIGACRVVSAIRRGEWSRSQRRAWLVVVVLAVVTTTVTIASDNKATRFVVTALPAAAMLAALAPDQLVFGERARSALRLGTIGAGFILLMHNCFAVLPVPALRLGDLRIIDCRFPLNVPDWFDDNHPLDRRHYPIADAARFIAEDAAISLPAIAHPRAVLTAAGLLMSHNAFTFLGGSDVIQYMPSHLVDTRFDPGGPEYIVHSRGYGEIYPGTHFFDAAPELDREIAEHRISYDEARRFAGPDTCEIIIYRRQMLTPLNGAGGVHPISVEAETFTAGDVQVLHDGWGKGIGVIASLGTSGFAEYEIDVPAEGLYQLDVRYAAAESRPLRLLIDGVVISQSACAQATGGWGPADQRWVAIGRFSLHPHLRLRLEREGAFPHIDKFAINAVSAPETR